MRARNLKPEFFKDKKIAELGPIPALVFEALWVLADDGGVALSSPDIVKGELFMRWSMIGQEEISDSLERLEKAGRISRYVVGDDEYATILRFSKHQKPHNPSQFRHPRAIEGVTAPKVERLPQGLGSTTEEKVSTRIPKALSLEPTPSPRKTVSVKVDNKGDFTADFEKLWSAYPKRAGGNSKHDAWLQFQARLRAGETFEAMLLGVTRYHAYCKATEKIGTDYVKQTSTFLGRARHYLETWEIPKRTGNLGKPEQIVVQIPHYVPEPVVESSPDAPKKMWEGLLHPGARQ